ncbi:purine-nucleoside phosphorylase [Halarsenatibacter silvermanii]|uniref:Purine nucleoside phosphorylase n=1 Tax=Halarsenatibacter silvermanii TaxID=321763 RepID=A0A1G9PIW7_9FIRM|nr:purine-nucleoside phosphorylase [Halarsenatibacter silvermanii]SDL98679.1 purine-nucleoside phosphorylase [Halarsenatibacter silvermanii]
MSAEIMDQIDEAVKAVEKDLEEEPEFALILGSGLGVLADEIEDPVVVSYEDIPNFPVSTVEGHAGQLVCGTLEGRQVVTMQGRFHYYEGYSMQEIALPVRVMSELGCEGLIVTNAAGGINRDYDAGDFMVISDHINMTGDNPLRGENPDELGPRFPDMTQAYDSTWQDLAEDVASEQGIKTRRGVYAGMVGPSYETPAEIRMLETMGADAVGMSTVPEVITANHIGLRVLGISCITNMAAGILPKPLSHEDVVEIADQVRPDFIKLVRAILQEFGKHEDV